LPRDRFERHVPILAVEAAMAAIRALRTKSHLARASEPGPKARNQRSRDPTW
jgi:hypothetical protein